MVIKERSSTILSIIQKVSKTSHFDKTLNKIGRHLDDKLLTVEDVN